MKGRKLEQIKNLLVELHSGKNLEDVRERAKKIFSEISPVEIGLVEQMLLREGRISASDIALLCDLHVKLFKDRLLENEQLSGIPPGHPLHTLIRESEKAFENSEKLYVYSMDLGLRGDKFKDINRIRELAANLLRLRPHFVRLQLLIFPYLERRGLTAIPRVLWMKQIQLMNSIKAFLGEINSLNEDAATQKELKKISGDGLKLSEEIANMVFREMKILYPTLKTLLREGEWLAVRNEEDLIGYYEVKPENPWSPDVKPIYPYEIRGEKISDELYEKLPPEARKALSLEKEVFEDGFIREGDLEMREGYLSPREMDGILNALPVDISFVDADNKLRYYNRISSRIFPRTRTVLGRPVGLCHPPKSVHIVKKIIEAFRKGERDHADFWINMNGRMIYIRYFPVRDSEGRYLGTLEVVQDVTEIRKLEGEKRLLDWK